MVTNSMNPFDDDNEEWNSSYESSSFAKKTHSFSPASTARTYRNTTTHRQVHNPSSSNQKTPLWMARPVEWPLVNSLPASTYNKLLRASKQTSHTSKKLPFGGSNQDDGIPKSSSPMDNASLTTAVGKSSNAENNDSASSTGYFPGLSGMMGRVFTSNAAGMNASTSGKDVNAEDDSLNVRPRALKSPRHGCVAASNGWIVACMDCTMNHNMRLLSRWNIKAGGGTSSNALSSVEKLIPLPAPSLRGDASIAHIFVDPTGNHILLSSKNGEAYYLHSSTPRVSKLNGFGGDHSGMAAAEINISRNSTASATNNSNALSQIQLGISANSYVTAVAWDKQMGTEGSTKKILLGTSLGEIYEYSLMSPAMASNMTTSNKSKKEDDGNNEVLTPLLLVRLFASSETAGGGEGAVTGLHFERVGGATRSLMGTTSNNSVGEDIVVLAATSGSHKRTRLHTFRSISSSLNKNNSFRHVFSPNQEGNINSFVELPGSIDFADLKVCGDGFAMRTETGIYYGTIDKSDSLGNVVSVATGGAGGTGIVDAGILPYESIQQKQGSNLPVSIAITSHHFVALFNTNEVRFINRVARKVVQKERVDWVAMASAASAVGSTNISYTVDDGIFTSGDAGELMMDIRRPDQIWLRKSRTLVHITSSNESRDVWKFTLEKCIDSSSQHRTNTSSTAKLLMHTRQLSATTSTMIPPLSKEEKVIDAQFEHSKSLCSNNTQRAVVTAFRAEYHLLHGRVELAAKYMAQCPSSILPFANTATRLALPILGIDDFSVVHSSKAKEALSESNLGLITYLSDKLRHFKTQNDTVASSMIGAWLTELHLNERERGISKRGGYNNSNNSLLHQFLTANVYNMDAKTILRILSSHDANASECARYAATSGEIGTAINAALCIDDKINGAMDALRVLHDAPFEQAEPHYYKHASVILSRVPLAAAKSFLARYVDGLSPTKLLPAFMHYERKRSEFKKEMEVSRSNTFSSDDGLLDSGRLATLQIDGSRSYADGNGVEIRIDGERKKKDRLDQLNKFVDDCNASVKYLEGVISMGCQSTAVFNFLISLYSNMEDEDPLFRFLSTHVPAASAMLKSTRGFYTDPSTVHTKRTSPPLDMSYALRVILRSGRHYRSAVKLYMGFEMRQQAVELAIKVDPSLARELARESVGADEQKKLWLMIARNAAADGESGGGKDVVSKVLSVLNDCGPDILSIEDVLPFMPDVAQIDQFKDEICSALTSYSSKIDGYWKEMNECDQTCDALRDEIARLTDYSVQVKSDARCAFSKRSVLREDEPFYIFPSGFVALESSLIKEVMPNLNEIQRARVQELRTELSKLKNNSQHDSSMKSLNYKDSQLKLDLQSELDGLIAAECPLTGSMMVDSIDRGFLDRVEEK